MMGHKTGATLGVPTPVLQRVMSVVIYITYCVRSLDSQHVCVCLSQGLVGGGLEWPQTVMIINMIINNIKVRYV